MVNFSPFTSLFLAVAASRHFGVQARLLMLEDRQLHHPCRLTTIETDGEVDYDYFCELDPQDADGVVGVVLPITGLSLTNMVSGQTMVFVEGYFIRDSVITIPAAAGEDQVNVTETPASAQFPTAPTPFGDKKVAVIRVNALDGQPGATAEEISDGVFGTDGDPFNMVTQFAACSFDQFRLWAFSGTVNGQEFVNGVYETYLDIPFQGLHKFAAQSEVTLQLADELGPQWYLDNEIDHVMYMLPDSVEPFRGYAYFRNHLSVYSSSWATSPSCHMHEIGHNLNLGHSNEVTSTGGSREYADQSGLMGFSYPSLDDSPAMCFNGPKSWQLGWYEGSYLEIDYLEGWTGRLVGVVDYDPELTNQTIVLRFEAGFELYYYIAFNHAVSFNSGTLEGKNQVCCKLVFPGLFLTAFLETKNQVMITSQAGTGKSTLLKKLNAGDMYEEDNFDLDESTLRIIVKDIDDNGATVTVEAELPECETGIKRFGLVDFSNIPPKIVPMPTLLDLELYPQHLINVVAHVSDECPNKPKIECVKLEFADDSRKELGARKLFGKSSGYTLISLCVADYLCLQRTLYTVTRTESSMEEFLGSMDCRH